MVKLTKVINANYNLVTFAQKYSVNRSQLKNSVPVWAKPNVNLVLEQQHTLSTQAALVTGGNGSSSKLKTVSVIREEKSSF